MKHAGINAVVVDPRRLTLKDLKATVKAAKGARLWVIEVVPPAGANATRSVKTVRATCRAPRKPTQTICAASTGSLSAAIALSRSGSAGPMVAVRLSGPAQVARFRSVSSSGSRILALVKLRAHRYATSAWRKAIGVAATTSSLDLAVTPTSSSNQTLSPYLNQLGKPPPAPGSLAVTGSTASTISVAWAAVVGATEYNITANGKFSGKTATTSFTVGGLACSTTYKLAVTAKNASGKTSKASTLMASTASCSDTTPPTVSVTAPTADATVSGNVSVTASASDNVGLAKVEFWVDGVQEAADASPPYSYGWDTTQDAGGPHTILVKAVDTSNNSASNTVGVTVSNSPCVTSSTSWQNTAMLSPDGTFDVSFDATPSAGNVDAVTGLSAAPASVYTDLAVIARFNSSGSIDAINGGGYAAANTVPYAGGSTYHFRAAVNVPNHSYSLYVTPPGTPETPVALNYAFRTGQTGVTALSNWAVTAASGSHQTCGFAVTNPGDMTAPSAPTGLAKTSSTQTSLSLSWAASTDNVGTAGYTVYVNGTASSAASGTSRTLSALSCGSTYMIGVDAYDAAGNHSGQTSTTMSTSACPDTTPPSTPTNLQKSGSTATSVTLSWTGSTDNVGVTGYTLYVNGAQVATTTGTSATATGLSCGTAYTMAVDAFDAAGNHSAKASISASTAACPGDTTPPSTPTGLTTSAVGQTSITLSWTASSDNVGVSGYRLYLGSSQVGTSPSTSYLFSGLACGTSYTLGVAAVDGAGNVSGTATISAATAPCSASSQFSGTFDCYGTTGCTSLPAAAPCTSTISGGLQTALNNAAGGSVICLNSGSYGNVSLSSKSYSSDVIVQPAANASVTIGSVTLNAVAHLHFTGNGGGSATMSIGGSFVDKGTTNCSSNITFDYATYTAPVNIHNNSGSGCSVNVHQLWDHDKFDALTSGDYEGRISITGDGAASATGIVFSNSSFQHEPTAAACSDAFFLADTNGVQIGPGNEFSDLPQTPCNPVHVDPIGGFTSHNTVVVGNYFHDNGNGSGGILSDLEPGQIVKNNVFMGSAWYTVLVKGAQNNTYTHNVFVLYIDWQKSNEGTCGFGNVVRNNVFLSSTGIAFDDCPASGYTADHNLGNPTCTYACDTTGRPVFVSNPSSGYYHYQLASTSPGYHAASDGKSMGIAP
jgi:chitodextrinase